MHKSHLERYTSLTANKRKRASDNAACSSPAPKQLRLDQCGQRASVVSGPVWSAGQCGQRASVVSGPVWSAGQCGQRASVSQQTVDRLVMDVVVEGLLPFSLVSLPSVKALVTGLLGDRSSP